MAGIFVTLLFLVVVGTPFSWKKFKGGKKAEWIGFQVDVSRGELGLIEKRFRWARDWMARRMAWRPLRNSSSSLGLFTAGSWPWITVTPSKYPRQF